MSETESTSAFIFITIPRHQRRLEDTIISLDRPNFLYFHLGVDFASEREHIEVISFEPKLIYTRFNYRGAVDQGCA